MQEASLSVVLGVVAGVLTAFILFVATRFWSSTLLPMLKQWKYSGVEIEDIWKSTSAGTNEQGQHWSTEVTLNLTQSTLDVSGVMVVRWRSPGNSFDLTFNASGRIWEGYVTLGFTPVSRTVTAVATALFKIGNGGVSLDGQFLYRHVAFDRVEVMPMSLQRTNNFQMQTQVGAQVQPPQPLAPAATPHPTAPPA